MTKNYFIHGTNSSLLGLIKKTNFEIASPIDLMRDYKVGPMTGELIKGGYRIHHHKNNTSFYRLFDGSCLERVIGEYTAFEVATKTDTKEKLLKSLKSSPKFGFSNINQILFYCARARQLGIELDRSPFKEAIDNFLKYANTYVQFLYLFKLIGIYIFPDNEKFNSLPEQVKNTRRFGNDFEDVIYGELTMENILENICTSNLDIRSIADNPCEEGLQKVLRLFALSSSPTTHSEHWGRKAKDVNLGGETQFFTTTKNTINCNATMSNNARYLFEGLIANSHYRIEEFLSKLFGETGFWGKREILPLLIKERDKKLLEMSCLVDEEINHIRDRFEIFRSILEEPKETYQFQSSESKFFNNKFPVILLSDRDELISSHYSEYRLKDGVRLKLGIEINLIATDNDAHRLEILNFLNENNIMNVQVVLFSDLKAAKSERKEIAQGIYPISGNIELLSKFVWLNYLSKVAGYMTVSTFFAFAALAISATLLATMIPLYIGASIFLPSVVSYLSVQRYKTSVVYNYSEDDALAEVHQTQAPATFESHELSGRNLPGLKLELNRSPRIGHPPANPSEQSMFKKGELIEAPITHNYSHG